MASKWMKMNFPDLATNRKIVDNVKNYLNVQYEKDSLATFRENPKTSFLGKN